jgi:hypothetical protein
MAPSHGLEAESSADSLALADTAGVRISAEIRRDDGSLPPHETSVAAATSTASVAATDSEKYLTRDTRKRAA